MAVNAPIPLSAESVSVSGADISFIVSAPPAMMIQNRIVYSFAADSITTASPNFFAKPVIQKPVYVFAAFNIDGELLSYVKPIINQVNSEDLTAVSLFSNGHPTAIRPVMKLIKPTSLNAISSISNASPSAARPVIKVIKPNSLGAATFVNSSPTISNRPVLE